MRHCTSGGWARTSAAVRTVPPSTPSRSSSGDPTRRVVENLATPTTAMGALRDVVDGWFHVLDRDLADEAGATVTAEAVLELAQRRVWVIAEEAPPFAGGVGRLPGA